MVAALQILQAVKNAGQKLAELKAGMNKFPQHMINVKAANTAALQDNSELNAAVAEVEQQLGERGRVLLRPSGTEPVVRVMVEGEELAEVEKLCGQLAARVEALL